MPMQLFVGPNALSGMKRIVGASLTAPSCHDGPA